MSVKCYWASNNLSLMRGVAEKVYEFVVRGGA